MSVNLCRWLHVKRMTFLYFGYGSNLLRERLTLENPSAEFVSTAVLKDYELTFSCLGRDPVKLRWRGGAASIAECPGGSVWGCVWRLDNVHLKSLDRQEGVYKAKQVDVTTPDGTLHSCRTYQLPADLLTNKEFDNRPSPAYMDIIIRGARQNKLPDEYVSYLNNIETNGTTEKPEVYKRTLELIQSASPT